MIDVVQVVFALALSMGLCHIMAYRSHDRPERPIEDLEIALHKDLNHGNRFRPHEPHRRIENVEIGFHEPAAFEHGNRPFRNNPRRPFENGMHEVVEDLNHGGGHKHDIHRH